MSMATDEERREVARRLRELRGGWSSGECYYTIIHELDMPDTSREDGGHALYGALADLIEPPTQCPYYHSDRHYCSVHDDVVDRDARREGGGRVMSLTYDVLKDDVRARRPIDFGFVTYVPERTCQFFYDEKPDEYMCSACGKRVSGSNPDAEYEVSVKAVLEWFNFCPHCGARVIKEDS